MQQLYTGNFRPFDHPVNMARLHGFCIGQQNCANIRRLPSLYGNPQSMARRKSLKLLDPDSSFSPVPETIVFGTREADMRVALYLRVSTDGQTVENQRRELQAVAGRHGVVGAAAARRRPDRG